MSLLTNLWFPNGAQLTDFAGLTAGGVQYAPVTSGTLAISDVAARVSLVESPDGSGDTVCKLYHPAADSAINEEGKKTQLTPAFTSAVRDPITNWVGYSASRRWYRFKFMLPEDWEWETWNNSSQRCVPFQVHDTADTSPADAGTSPPLWLIAYPDRTMHFDVTSCSATQTTSSNFTVRSATRIRPVPLVPMDVVVWVKWAWDSTGAMKIWLDRRKIYDESGVANCLNNDAARGGNGQFVNICAYASADVVDRTIYHWGIQVGDESYTTFNEFMAACGSSDTELEGYSVSGMSLASS